MAAHTDAAAHQASLRKRHDLSTIATMNLSDDEGVARLIQAAKEEDLGDGDLTTALMADAAAPASFRLHAKQRGVFAGCEVAGLVVAAYDESIQIEWSNSAPDGFVIETVPTVLATIEGPLGSILSAERVLLNFLQRLSGIATVTREYVDAVEDTTATIYDTRKTTPGWRVLERYAVRVGSGSNHRDGLYDAVLIKDNHLAGIEIDRLAAAVFEMLNRLPQSGRHGGGGGGGGGGLGQGGAVLSVVGIGVSLLGNCACEGLSHAVAMRDEYGVGTKVALEAAGGITLQTVRDVARTGVDRISVGALTHSAPSLDLSLERV